MTSHAAAGADGWRGGWVAAVVDGDRRVQWHLPPDATALLALAENGDAAAPPAALGVDMPIGLPEDGPRAADLAARRLLPGATSSVFPAPLRTVLAAADYADACARSRAAAGWALSKQAWHLVPSIRDLDAVLGADEQRHRRVVEVHPEASFRRLDPAVRARKRSAAGVGQRLGALARWLGDRRLTEALATVPDGPGLDDVLDALAAAWSARRWADGDAEVLPGTPWPVDSVGRPMRIVV